MSNPQGRFAKIAQKIEFRLVLFFAGMGALIYIGISTWSIRAVISTYLLFAIIIGLIYFWREILIFLFSPVFLVLWITHNLLVKRYLKKQNFKQNVPAETVVFLGHSNWFLLDGWLTPIFFLSEIKQLVATMKAEKRDFSFYPNAHIADVENIMSDKNITEVYFYGHGSTHAFRWVRMRFYTTVISTNQSIPSSTPIKYIAVIRMEKV